MTIQDDIKKLAAKSKINKILVTVAALIGGALMIAFGATDQGKQLISIGEETATVQVQDGAVVGVTSSSAPVSVQATSPSK